MTLLKQEKAQAEQRGQAFNIKFLLLALKTPREVTKLIAIII